MSHQTFQDMWAECVMELMEQVCGGRGGHRTRQDLLRDASVPKVFGGEYTQDDFRRIEDLVGLKLCSDPNAQAFEKLDILFSRATAQKARKLQ